MKNWKRDSVLCEREEAVFSKKSVPKNSPQDYLSKKQDAECFEAARIFLLLISRFTLTEICVSSSREIREGQKHKIHFNRKLERMFKDGSRNRT